ncbi:MAG: hypothetical protein L0I92_06660 [Staphylococcus equorum]|nr:hypothetical protein [Staphylococcus equorum]
MNEKKKNLQILARYKKAFKENEIKRREITEENKGLLAEIKKIQDKLLNDNEV